MVAIALGTSMALAVSAGFRIAGRRRTRRVPLATLTVALAVVGGFAIQSVVPGTIAAFQRDAPAVGTGEWWRLLTALFLQDGGLAGFGSNLAGLLLVGTLAEQLVSRAAWFGLYFAPALAAEVIALRWQPVGAGNSIAWMALAGALFSLALRQRSRAALSALGAAGLAIGTALALSGNIHGPPLLLGAVLAWGTAVIAPTAILTATIET